MAQKHVPPKKAPPVKKAQEPPVKPDTGKQSDDEPETDSDEPDD